MDPVIISAIIGAAGVVTAPVVVLFIKRVIDLRPLAKPPKERRDVLQGIWKGLERQSIGPFGEPIEYEVTCKIKWRGKLAYGTFNFVYSDDSHIIDETLSFTGGFFFDRFLRLEYYDSEGGKVQFGALVLELDENSRELRGLDVGFGYVTKQILSGSVELTKSG